MQDTPTTRSDDGIQRRTALQVIGAGLLTAGGLSAPASASTAEGTTIYIAGGADRQNDGAVHAVSQAGEEVWSWTPPEPDSAFGPNRLIGTPPTVVDGTLYVINKSDTLYGIDAASGEPTLEMDVPDDGAPTVVDDRLYAVGWDTAFAVDLTAEEVIWEKSDDDWAGEPLVVDGSVYLTRENDSVTVASLDAADGEIEWEYDGGYGEYSGANLLDETLFVTGEAGAFDPGELIAIDITEGEDIWVEPLEDGFGASEPVIYDGRVFVSDDEYVLAFDADSGEREWSTHVAAEHERGAQTYPPTVAGDKVFVTSDFGVDCLAADSGDSLWRYEEGITDEEMLADAPTVHDGVVYVTTTYTQNTFPDHSTLHAIDTDEGDRVWAFDPDPDTMYDGHSYDTLDGLPTVVEDPASGDSVDSRIRQAIYGHTSSTTGADPAGLAGDGADDGATDGLGGGTGDGNGVDDDDGFAPGFGIAGAVAGLGGAAYVLRRRLADRESR